MSPSTKPKPRARNASPGLLERLAQGPVICAEGYVFELERRGYLQAGAFVPVVLTEHPEVVEELHREFAHAGSDVTQALTYYAHREKLRVIGREKDLARMNRTALKIAKKVARETGTLFAGDICNTNIYDPGDRKALQQVQRILAEQVGWAVDAGVDYIVAETFSWAGEALLALEAIKKHAGVPAVVTLAIHREEPLRDGFSPAEACRRLEAAGADVVGLNCHRGPATMLPLLKKNPQSRPLHGGGVAGALPHHAQTALVHVAHRSLLRQRARVSGRAGSFHLHPRRDCAVRTRRVCARRRVSRRLLWRRTASYSGAGGELGPPPAGQPLWRRYVKARLLRHR